MIDVKHHFGGGVYAKQVVVPRGHTLCQHQHKFDHLSVLASGRALVAVDGRITEHCAPDCILIAAGKEHYIEALDDVVWFCIHATEETDPAKVDDAVIAR